MISGTIVFRTQMPSRMRLEQGLPDTPFETRLQKNTIDLFSAAPPRPCASGVNQSQGVHRAKSTDRSATIEKPRNSKRTISIIPEFCNVADFSDCANLLAIPMMRFPKQVQFQTAKTSAMICGITFNMRSTDVMVAKCQFLQDTCRPLMPTRPTQR